MININLNQDRYILRPTVPNDTTYISYTVSIGGNLIFSGGGQYFGGRYEIDCSGWIEDYINNNLETEWNMVALTVVFTFSGGTTQTMTKTWVANEFPSLPFPSCYPCYLTIQNSGFIQYDENDDPVTIRIPLKTVNGYLYGKTVNKLDKINSINRYGNIIPGSVTNHFELECYVDPDWLNVETGKMYSEIVKDLAYEKVMLALQNAKSIRFYFNNAPSDYNRISGIEDSFTVPHITSLNVHVKDVEKIETYSSYSTDKKVPSLKITLEVFNS